MVDKVRKHPTFQSMVDTISSLDEIDLLSPLRNLHGMVRHHSGRLADIYGEKQVDLKDWWKKMGNCPRMSYVKEWVDDSIAQVRITCVSITSVPDRASWS